MSIASRFPLIFFGLMLLFTFFDSLWQFESGNFRKHSIILLFLVRNFKTLERWRKFGKCSESFICRPISSLASGGFTIWQAQPAAQRVVCVGNISSWKPECCCLQLREFQINYIFGARQLFVFNFAKLCLFFVLIFPNYFVARFECFFLRCQSGRGWGGCFYCYHPYFPASPFFLLLEIHLLKHLHTHRSTNLMQGLILFVVTAIPLVHCLSVQFD